MEENPFFTFEKDEPAPIAEPVPVKIFKKKQAPKEIKSTTFSGVMPEKIMVNRSVDTEGNVCVCWADKDTIHPLALQNYDKYKQFY